MGRMEANSRRVHCTLIGRKLTKEDRDIGGLVEIRRSPGMQVLPLLNQVARMYSPWIRQLRNSVTHRRWSTRDGKRDVFVFAGYSRERYDDSRVRAQAELQLHPGRAPVTSRQSFSYIQTDLQIHPGASLWLPPTRLQLSQHCTDCPAFHTSPPHKTVLQTAQTTAYWNL